MTFFLLGRNAENAADSFAIAQAPAPLDMGQDAPDTPAPPPPTLDMGRAAEPPPPPAERPKGPSYTDRLWAGWVDNRIRKDQWSRSQRFERDLIDELVETIPPQYLEQDQSASFLQPRPNRYDWLLDAATRARNADADRFGTLPTSIEDIEAEVMRRRRADFDDAQAIIGAAPDDSWGVPELVGAIGADITSPEGLAMFALPIASGGSVLRIALMEGALAGTEEALSLPDQFRVADDLDLPEPDPLPQVGGAALGGAVLGGAVASLIRGGQRFLEYRRTRDEAEAARRPEDARPLDHRRQLDQAQDDLAAGREPTQPESAPFDWSRHITDGGTRPDAISGMTVPLRSGLEAMIQGAPPRIREGLQVYSGFRSVERQERLWADALRKYGSPEAARKWVAPPGRSNHNSGAAADLKWNGLRIDQAPSDVRDWLHRNARLYGLHFPLKHEPWHVETLGTRGTAPARPRDASDGQPLRFEDFDFGARGNASPSANPVGYVYGQLLAKGYTPEQASGLLGNLIQESGPRLDTGAVGDGGNAIGMGQWNGPRKRALEAFARARGADWRDLDTQIDFLDHELRTTEKAAGDAIRAATSAADAARIASERFWRPGIPRLGQRVGYAEDLMNVFSAGYVPYYPGSRASGGDAPAQGGASFSGYTSRGYTGSGQVTTGDGMTIDVEYQVVDLADLRGASGDLQPRDRTRAASDEQVAEIAARLDPARLMPSPEADRGAPIVGPDGIIESGNGRVMAIGRSYDLHADRAEAYRRQIELMGFAIPEGMERPVLIARRNTELDDAGRQRLVRSANQSQIARMSATERAAMEARTIGSDVLSLYRGGRLDAPENADFVRRFLDTLPQAERSGLVDNKKIVNREGLRRLGDALFARAFDAPDLLARYTETDAGDLKSLLNALEQAAPDWAAMRAAVADGTLRPEMDITPFVLNAMRMIALARETAAREGGKVAEILDELIASIDLLDGAVPPLTVALVRKFMPGGRAAGADKVADFLKRYATEARKIGGSDGALFDAPGPLDALKAIDRDTFGDLSETGAARLVEPPRAEDPLPVAPRALAEEAARMDAADVAAEDMLRAAMDNPQAQGTDPEVLASLRAAADLEVTLEDGTMATVAEFLDDLDADEVLATVVDLCGLKGAA